MHAIATNVLTNNFFWLVVGAVLSWFGAWALACFQHQRRVNQERTDVIIYCRDIVTNIVSICAQAKQAKERGAPFRHELQLLRDEIAVFARTRSLTVELDEELRNKVSRYVVDCALGQADVARYLDENDGEKQFEHTLQVSGGHSGAQREAKDRAEAALEKARGGFGSVDPESRRRQGPKQKPQGMMGGGPEFRRPLLPPHPIIREASAERERARQSRS